MYNRKIYKRLIDCKNSCVGSAAFLLIGAPCIGKTTIAKEFAEKQYADYLYIDFSNATKTVSNIFSDISDFDRFLSRLRCICKVSLPQHNSLIVLDNVDFFPPAREAASAITEDGRYDCLSISSHNIPCVENEKPFRMFPMDFEEFLAATGDYNAYLYAKMHFAKRISIASKANAELINKFKMYMLLGGMPKVIEAFNNTGNPRKAELVKREILELYKKNIHFDCRSEYANLIFQSIPNQIGGNASRFRFPSLPDGCSKKHAENAKASLEQSNIILKGHHVLLPYDVNCGAYDSKRYKYYICDTGLLATMLYNSSKTNDISFYSRVMNDSFGAKYHIIYSNVCAQIIAAAERNLLFYTFPDTSSKRNTAIDFILVKQNNIIPILLRPSGYKSDIALYRLFEHVYVPSFRKYVLYTKCPVSDGQTDYMPFYMLPFITENADL